LIGSIRATSRLIPHLREHRLDVVKPQLLVARPLKVPKRLELMHGDQVSFDGGAAA
jgi:hypothetical protein